MRYIIGIDLGTTNSSMAFVDTKLPGLPIQLFQIPQLTAPGKIGRLPTLPSFCYWALEGEWPKGALSLPWQKEKELSDVIVVGQFAKTQGARIPTRLIQSAKSWLCNAAVCRKDKILPLEASDPSKRISPLEASTLYLAHLRDAWNEAMCSAKTEGPLELEEQEIILTVPASFDEIARALTVEAAKSIGCEHLTLIEEPQAAFYHWMAQHERGNSSRFRAGEKILVCDVGGGTTDFSLIEIQKQGNELSFQRMAVGEHLLLGGDNMDAALAHLIESKLIERGDTPLEPHQWTGLICQARAAKEALLAPQSKAKESFSVVLQGSGSSVVGGSLSISMSRKEVEQHLLEGFFSYSPLESAKKINRSRGVRTAGLPYEDDPSLIKHLARFLDQSGILNENEDQGIDYILFNGGTFTPPVFQEAIEHSLRTWFSKKALTRLDSSSLEVAVAKGAAYYGKVRRMGGTAIKGGAARAYYLKIDTREKGGLISSKALTLLPRGAEDGASFQPETLFSLRPGAPVSFQLYSSHTRLNDQQGDLIDIDPLELQPLPPIQTVLRFGKNGSDPFQVKTVPVRLGIALTPIGTVALWLTSTTTAHKWNLEFQIRSAEGEEKFSQDKEKLEPTDETLASGSLEEAKKLFSSVFCPSPALQSDKIMEQLELLIQKPRREWSSSILRELFGALLPLSPFRKISPMLEARFWNLAGFLLRPGAGYPLDDYRVKEMWKALLGELKISKSDECLIQMCIFVRRISAGLNKGQQMQVANELIGHVLDKKTGRPQRAKKEGDYLFLEKVRTLASLERLDLPFKIKLAQGLLDLIAKGKADKTLCWALGRLAARELLYASAAFVIPKETVEKFVESLLAAQKDIDHQLFLSMIKQIAKRSPHRELNLSPLVIKKIVHQIPQEGLEEILLKEAKKSEKELEFIFGDSLPSGLFLELDRAPLAFSDEGSAKV